MRRSKKGNIILVFVFLIGFLGIVLAYGYLITGSLRGAGARSDTFAAFYTAEAGLQKAIWYLNTPETLGGKETGWRTTSLIEAYGNGSYRMQVQSAPGNMIVITSEGTVGNSTRKVQMTLQSSGLPPAFDYAIFNNGALTLKSATSVHGSVFANGNVKVNIPSVVNGGQVYYSPGYSVSGSGSYTNGGSPNPPPTMPVLDTTPYTSMIAITKSSDPAVLHGSQNFTNYNFTGQTIYVDGDVNISGALTGGGGTIVSSGKVTVSGALSGPISIYASKEVNMSGSLSITQSCVLYGGNNVTISGACTVYGTILSSYVKINGAASIYGILYSWNVGIDLLGAVSIHGSVVNPAAHTYNGAISITYDPAYIPSFIPGMSAGGLNIVPHTWKEL